MGLFPTEIPINQHCFDASTTGRNSLWRHLDVEFKCLDVY